MDMFTLYGHIKILAWLCRFKKLFEESQAT